MIFRAEMLKLVLSGEKTVTRRRGKARYIEGRTYAVQPGRGQFHVAHIKMHMVTREPLAAIYDLETRREGFMFVSDFVDYWTKLHGTWNPDEMVTRIQFYLAPRCPACPAETQ